ncbi:helix-turn-helix transcriptional regulator [Novosphingobium resinovorum]|uniref:helix-turn-helix transcriptional regulator n=1 Tax=Novosphingobium resinovorum TaxID=158500 RepID=UPI002ED05302|nr:helix-turn-helix transcriptional regulator [Novosphingobium resinovorum]
MSSRDNLARNLRLLRAAKGMSQESLAHEAGIHRTYVSALERREYSVSIDRLDSIAASLGVQPYVLLMDELPRGTLEQIS